MTHAAAVKVRQSLAAYEEHVRELVRTWLDMELYRTVSAEIDEIRALCTAMPELSVPWVKLLISHAELIHCLWRGGEPGHAVAPTPAELQDALDDHLACIARLAARSRRAEARLSQGG